MHKTPRALLSALAFVGLIASGLAITTAPAAATTDCQVSISGLPSKITIDSGNRRYWVTGWSKGCNLDTDNSDISADIAGPNTLRDRIDYIWTDFDGQDHITLYTSDYKAGKYTVVDSSSFIEDGDYNDLHYTWVQKTFVAKYRTYTSLSAKRSGSSVKLSGTVKRYNPDWYGYVAYKQPVSIQRHTGGTWHTIKTVSSTGGKYSYTYKTSGKYSYRAKIAETSTTLGSVSGTHSTPAGPKTHWYASKVTIHTRKATGKKRCIYGDAMDAAGKVARQKKAWEDSIARRVYIQKRGSHGAWKTVKTVWTQDPGAGSNYNVCAKFKHGKYRSVLKTYYPFNSEFYKAKAATSRTVRVK